MNVAKVITQAELPMARSNKLLDSLWTTMKNTARWQLTSSALHGFMGGLQTCYGYAQDLNSSLNNIRVVTGQSSEQMADFARNANEAAKALSSTTTNYTDAALIYYQQGLRSQEDIQGRTDTTIKMANVTGTAAKEVSDQMTAIWNNFYDGSKSLEYYADVITALGAETASSSAEISDGLEKFAAIANSVGLSYEYATSALATVTATTRQSADVVGNAFKTLFARIQGLNLGETLDDGTTLNKYSEALMKVGISIKDQNGELKQMDTILEEMASKWQTLNKDQQLGLAQTVAGVRQYTQLVALMDNWDFMQENLQTAGGASGTLQEQADIYAESWEAARDRVRAAAEDVYASIINEDFFIGLDNSIVGVLERVDDVIDSMGGFSGVLITVGTLMTSVYGDRMAQGIRNMAYNVSYLMGIEQARAVELKKAATAQLQQMADDLASPELMSVANAYREQAQAQIELNDASQQLTTFQQE
ncbi:MAG: phage tail tape measure protein [Acetobacter sp.]|nr:phage tail tape measure protein [Acetobacter sp.]